MVVNTFGILDLSTADLVVILAIILLLFGGKKLPELTKSLGSSVKELRKGLSDEPDKTVTTTASKSENQQ